jgi:hypothetical protein
MVVVSVKHSGDGGCLCCRAGFQADFMRAANITVQDSYIEPPQMQDYNTPLLKYKPYTTAATSTGCYEIAAEGNL